MNVMIVVDINISAHDNGLYLPKNFAATQT
jgi:hypothetical protein